MSSIMRRRSGLMGAWLMGAPGLEVRLLTPRSSSRNASRHPLNLQAALRPSACSPQASAQRFRSLTEAELRPIAGGLSLEYQVAIVHAGDAPPSLAIES